MRRSNVSEACCRSSHVLDAPTSLEYKNPMITTSSSWSLGSCPNKSLNFVEPPVPPLSGDPLAHPRKCCALPSPLVTPLSSFPSFSFIRSFCDTNTLSALSFLHHLNTVCSKTYDIYHQPFACRKKNCISSQLYTSRELPPSRSAIAPHLNPPSSVEACIDANLPAR